ncbi:hypothetical protein J3R83DRAFT_11701 [Lanmaoa asiatica]|nr:hypothetical protein J3R83DRAFT_11701 [Lanmaoa asiatica]
MPSMLHSRKLGIQSGAFPAVSQASHEFQPNSHKCEDQGLQDWILILCYYVWWVEKLRKKVFVLLGINGNAFGIDGEGRDAYAKWLGFNNSQHVSLHSCNLLDVLFVLASNCDQLFGIISVS